MNILLDSRFKELSGFLDKRHNIVLFDINSIESLSSDLDDSLDIVAETIYVKYVDNDIDLVVVSSDLLEILIGLDISNERIIEL